MPRTWLRGMAKESPMTSRPCIAIYRQITLTELDGVLSFWLGMDFIQTRELAEAKRLIDEYWQARKN